MADDGWSQVSSRKRKSRKKKPVTEDSDAKAAEVPTTGEVPTTEATIIREAPVVATAPTEQKKPTPAGLPTAQAKTAQSQPQSSMTTQNHVSAQNGGGMADTSVSVPETRSPAKVVTDDGWNIVGSRKRNKNRKKQQTFEADASAGAMDAVAAPMVNGVKKGSQTQEAKASNVPASNGAGASKKKKKKKKGGKKDKGDLVQMIIALIQKRDPMRSSLSLGDLGNFFQEDYGTSWNKSYKSSNGQMRTFILAHDEFVVKDEVVWLKAKAPKPPQAAPKPPPDVEATSPPRRKAAKKEKKKQTSKKAASKQSKSASTRTNKSRAAKPRQQELAGNGINWGFALMLLLSIGVICIAVALDQTSSSPDSNLLERIKQVLAGLGLPL